MPTKKGILFFGSIALIIVGVIVMLVGSNTADSVLNDPHKTITQYNAAKAEQEKYDIATGVLVGVGALGGLAALFLPAKLRP